MNAANNAEGGLANNPTLASDAAQGIADTGTAYAYSAGYNAADGAAYTTADRSVGVVTVGPTLLSNATILQTQTAANSYPSTPSVSTIRSAVGSDTGSGPVYTGGGSVGGWRNFTSGTSTEIGTLANVRNVKALGSQLFGSTGSGTTVGVYLLNPGASTATSWISIGTSSSNSPYEFALFDDTNNSNTSNGYNVAYIADSGTVTGEVLGTGGGIEKWTWNGTAWSRAYTIYDPNLSSTDTGFKGYWGLAGELDSGTGNVALFATTNDGKYLEQFTDSLNSGTQSATDASVMTLATAGANYGFRGVALAPVPEPGTFALLGIGAMMGLAAYAWRRLRRA